MAELFALGSDFLAKITQNLWKKNNFCSLKNLKNTFIEDVFFKEL